MALEIKHLQTSEAKIDLSHQKDYFAEWQMAELKVSKAEKEIHRLKRALWLAHAYKAKFKRWWLHLALDCEASAIRPDTKTINRIKGKIGNCEKSERKCRAKAEEYK